MIINLQKITENSKNYQLIEKNFKIINKKFFFKKKIYCCKYNNHLRIIKIANQIQFVIKRYTKNYIKKIAHLIYHKIYLN